MKHKRKFQFTSGDEVREKVTGFVGTITGVAFYLTGCNSYLVVPKAKDQNVPSEGKWYDEGRLELIESQRVKDSEVSVEATGCDIMPTKNQ